MKYKFLMPIILSIVIGFFIGKTFFNNYDNSTSVFNEGEKVYFVELGVYSSLDEIKKIDNYEDYLTLNEEDGYHLYVGITKIAENSQKIKVYYEKLDNNIYIREKYVDNYSFLNILTEYDKICLALLDNKNLIDIERIVISNYKEMILENDSTN